MPSTKTLKVGVPADGVRKGSVATGGIVQRAEKLIFLNEKIVRDEQI
jgi:hypothetical protein